MSAPEYKEEIRHSKLPVDINTRPVSVLFFYDPATNQYLPASSVGVTGAGQCLNTNLVGGVMQVENLHVEMTATGLLDNSSPTPVRINPATENTLQDILEALGGGSTVNKFALFDSENVAPGTIPSVILDYTIPVGLKFRIESIRGWADVDAEFYVYIDTLQVDGYRTTPAQLTMNIERPAIQYATAGQHVIISAKHYKTAGSWLIKAAIQGTLETV